MSGYHEDIQRRVEQRRAERDKDRRKDDAGGLEDRVRARAAECRLDGLPADLWLSTSRGDVRFQVEADGTVCGAPDAMLRSCIGKSYERVMDMAEAAGGRVWFAWLPFGGDGPEPERPA